MSTSLSSPPAPLGLRFPVLVGLGLLAVPRVILHDLDLIHEGSLVNAVFVFLPPLVWVVVAVYRRVPNPFLTLLAVGGLYGVFLALGHQLLWDVSWGDRPPQLGGNLRELSPWVQGAILRGFAAVSSLFTGVIVGAVTGLVAWGVRAVILRTRAGTSV